MLFGDGERLARVFFQGSFMNILARVRNKVRALIQSRGTVAMKRALWNKEFGSGRWDHITDNTGDFVYDAIGRYVGGGAIVDLGCGVASLGVELPAGSYSSYTGVDISDVALAKARASAERAGRARTNRYIHDDIESYLPSEPVAVILVSECIYYVPKSRVASSLKRLASRLTPNGVILVRLFERERYADYVRIIENSMHVVEEIRDENSSAVIIVCRA